MKHRPNPVARALGPAHKLRIVRDRTKYSRKGRKKLFLRER